MDNTPDRVLTNATTDPPSAASPPTDTPPAGPADNATAAPTDRVLTNAATTAPPPTKGELTIHSALGKVDARTPEQEKLFQECEATISTGWDWFVKVGLALITIRDGRLFKNEFETFEQYYHARWNYRHTQVYNLISAAEVYEHLKTLPEVAMPDHESLVRPLVGLSPDQARFAWQTIVSSSGGHRITANMVKRAMRTLGLSAKKPVEPKPEATPQTRYQRRQAIREGFTEILTLLVKRSGHDAILEKVQLLQRHVEGLLESKKKRG
jgi:hypothetical protein